MKKQLLFWMLLCFYFTACYIDNGYAPSEAYKDKPVQYVVTSSTNAIGGYDVLPECNENIEGVIFYTLQDQTVYACVEGNWTYMRHLDPNTPEVQNATLFTGSFFTQGRSFSSHYNNLTTQH